MRTVMDRAALPRASSSATAQAAEFLSFRLGSEAYGIEIRNGLGTCEDQMLILLDIERLMSSAEMALTEHTAH